MASPDVWSDTSTTQGTSSVAANRSRSLRRAVGSAAAVIAATLLVASCGSGSSDGSPATSTADPAVTTNALRGQLVLGEEVYAANCASCHGSAGEGGFGPALADGAVVDRYPEVDDHRAVVVSGRGAMPGWGDTLTEDEIDAVVRYEREQLGQP